MPIIIVVVVLFFVAVVMVIMALTTSDRKQRIAERVGELQAARPVVDLSQSTVSRQLQQPFFDRVIKPVLVGINKKLLSICLLYTSPSPRD